MHSRARAFELRTFISIARNHGWLDKQETKKPGELAGLREEAGHLDQRLGITHGARNGIENVGLGNAGPIQKELRSLVHTDQ